MGNAVKVWKLSDDSEAFIELGEDYIRLGVGDQVSMIFDEDAINAAAKNVNWQMDPSKMSFQGILTHVGTLPGLFPVGPKYKISLEAVSAFTGILKAVNSIRGATGF